MSKKLAVIGGGAAGFFAAINAASKAPDMEVSIYEKSNQLLGKVKVSGGGRCNVTHACFEPKELIKFYPRGSKELLGPFHAFQPGDMFDWFNQRGIALKTEEDNRVFPESNSSQTIIDCFMDEAEKRKVHVHTGKSLINLLQQESKWQVEFSDKTKEIFDFVLIASGSSNTLWNLLEELGHEIIQPVPSLFTFNINDPIIKDLPGVSAPNCTVKIEGTKFAASGPVLITHWGLSGPGILRLSAWAARELASVKYDFIIRINWDNRFTKDTLLELLRDWRTEHSRSAVKAFSAIKVPHRLWCSLLAPYGKLQDTRWADVSNKQLEALADTLTACFIRVQGKSTFKDEFVTAGGVSLKEVDFKTMQSRILPGIYFAGEVMNIDAITGGFNFQAAWTTSYVAATSITKA